MRTIYEMKDPLFNLDYVDDDKKSSTKSVTGGCVLTLQDTDCDVIFRLSMKNAAARSLRRSLSRVFNTPDKIASDATWSLKTLARLARNIRSAHPYTSDLQYYRAEILTVIEEYSLLIESLLAQAETNAQGENAQKHDEDSVESVEKV